MKMVLKTLSVGELRSPNSTARQHNRQQRKKARALFSEHGIVVPIIVDERMQIIDGILRFEIAKEVVLNVFICVECLYDVSCIIHYQLYPLTASLCWTRPG